MSKYVLIDFWAPWCGPCKAMEPALKRLGEQFPDLEVRKVNVDENPELAEQYGVRGIPMMVVEKDGVKALEMVGSRTYEKLETEVKKVIAG